MKAVNKSPFLCPVNWLCIPWDKVCPWRCPPGLLPPHAGGWHHYLPAQPWQMGVESVTCCQCWAASSCLLCHHQTDCNKPMPCCNKRVKTSLLSIAHPGLGFTRSICTWHYRQFTHLYKAINTFILAASKQVGLLFPGNPLIHSQDSDSTTTSRTELNLHLH